MMVAIGLTVEVALLLCTVERGRWQGANAE